MMAADAVTRFAADLAALGPIEGGIGLAVSGGPDSLALLLLARAAFGDRVRAATVDHRLRPEAAAEARGVAALCATLDVPHDTLVAEWDEPPTANLQAQARDMRYELLGKWAADNNLGAVLTAHHADDQAETLLMRLARGSGVAGLAGARAKSRLNFKVWRLRPLLGWRRAELRAIVAAAGIEPVDDPTNRDPRFDRSRVRALLATGDWADPLRLAASASHLADAEEALRFITHTLAETRVAADGATIDTAGLPRELRRRLLVTALQRAGAGDLRGPDVDRLLATLDSGGTATLAGFKAESGPPWRLSPVPPHRHC
jgi:tRNA(Ile)-lysidine synthase